MDFYFQQTRRVPEKFSAQARSPPSRRKSNPYRTHNSFHFCMRVDPVPPLAASHFRTAAQSLSCLGTVRLRTLSPDNQAREPIISAHIVSWDYAHHCIRAEVRRAQSRVSAAAKAVFTSRECRLPGLDLCVWKAAFGMEVRIMLLVQPDLPCFSWPAIAVFFAGRTRPACVRRFLPRPAGGAVDR
jgi:hypothetical protein